MSEGLGVPTAEGLIRRADQDFETAERLYHERRIMAARMLIPEDMRSLRVTHDGTRWYVVVKAGEFTRENNAALRAINTVLQDTKGLNRAKGSAIFYQHLSGDFRLVKVP